MRLFLDERPSTYISPFYVTFELVSNRQRLTNEYQEPVEVFGRFPKDIKFVFPKQSTQHCGLGAVSMISSARDISTLPTVVRE